MRRALAIAVFAGVLAVPASATESTIYPGVGIGKVRLGMTKSQVEHLLGREHLVNARQGAYTEYAWNFATWAVGFENGHAVQVATTLASQKTRTGVGPGSSWRALVRTYPHGVCTINNGTWGRAEYLVPHKGGTQTIYIVANQGTPA